MATLIGRELVDDSLHALPGWEGDERQIARVVDLPPEQDAELRRRVTDDSEAMGHDADVEDTSGGTRFVLTTHDVGGVSELDIALASRISDLVHQIHPEEPGVEAVRDDEPEVVAGPAGAADAARVVQDARTQQAR